eukprot:TRINITY_DN12994_c0_g4_i1.p1 TRINITY_DN12994_c0_g4~~TRINITY_DN12994_c0_g4_i1.p1  ORF type:complete len:492 (+),score=122.37 TRINITY_DN12994_c0_g4_i1:1207-2682(+)
MLTVTSKAAKYTPSKEQMDEMIEGEAKELDKETVGELKQEVKKQLADENKKVLIITARIHPGETCSSFVMEGFIKFIISSDPAAAELRDKFVVKIIPMLNIDGVVMGNYRCCIIGQDLNRRFANPDIKLHPAICSIKNMITRLHLQGNRVFAYIDLHGHSRKKCGFIYGPYYPLHLNRYIRVRILPKLLSERTHMFRYAACKFRQENSKRNTARLVISREFDVMNSLTLESSFYAFFSEDRKTIEFCPRFYERMGEHLAGALMEYTRLLDEERVTKCRRVVENRRRRRCAQKAKSKPKLREQESPKKSVLAECREQIEELNVALKKEENPNEGDKEVVRFEECYGHLNEFTEIRERKKHRMEDLCESIKQDIQNEDMDECDSDFSDSSEEVVCCNEEPKAIVVIQQNVAKEPQVANKGKEVIKKVPLHEDMTKHFRGSSQRFNLKNAEHVRKKQKEKKEVFNSRQIYILSLIHICRCRRYAVCRSRWSPYH